MGDRVTVLSDDEWQSTYRPLFDDEGPLTLGDLRDRGISPECIWTLVDSGEGSVLIVSGVATVNRLGYIATKIPHLHKDIEVIWYEDEEDEDA